MFLTKYIFYAAIFAASSTTVFADVVEGVWKSAPDVNGLVVHVRAKPCVMRDSRACQGSAWI